MDTLTRFGLSHSRLTILIMIGLIVQGLFLFQSFPKREDPAITIRTAVVTSRLAGMAPERVEALIVTPIERKAREIGEVSEIRSLVTTGAGLVYIEIDESVPKAAIDAVFQDIRNKMAEVKGDLPAETSGPTVNTDYGDVVIASVAVTGEGFTYSEVEAFAEDLQKRLYTVDGVSKVSLFGEQDERIWLEIDGRKLASVGVQLNQVLNDLKAQNVVLPAGQINTAGTTIVLEASGDFETVDDIRNVLTKVQGLGAFVRLDDLVTVRRGYASPKVRPVYFNGEPTVIVAIEMTDGVDVTALGPRLRQTATDFEAEQPIGVSLQFSTYQAEKVREAVNTALINVGQTFGVVLIVMLVFLGLQSALVIACIVPFTIMFALIGMNLLGLQLEQVSIAAVIISLGLLVDNGLVVVEDIQGQIKAGVPPQQAALASGKQFVIPLAVASVTTVSAFIPMMILEGAEGEYAFSLGAVVALMLAGSWLTALYILPALAVWFTGRQTAKVEAGENGLIRIYGALIRPCLPLAPIIIAACYLLVVLSIGLFSQVRTQMFPLSERNQFLIYMDMPKGTHIAATEASALAIDVWLSDDEKNPEITNTTLYVGDGGPRFYLALSPAETNPASAFFLINTYDFQGARTAADRAWRYLYENHPEARFKVKRLAMGGSESGLVEVRISGTDAETLLSLASRVETAFAAAPGIVQNENDWGNKVVKVAINVDQDKAREIGVTSKQISDVLNTYFDGESVSTFREGDNQIPIIVRAAEPFRDSLEDLANMSIGSNGEIFSLDQVATFQPMLEFSQLRRKNQTRTVTITGKSTTRTAAQLLGDVQSSLDALPLPDGYQIEIGGEVESSGEVNAKLLAGMPIAITVMLVALMFQFNSARRVALTFMTIPLVLIGVPVALLLTGMPFSFFGTLGMIALAGIIINNAIVLIDQIDIERASADLTEAVIIASKKRFRPIMLTSLTTVFGLTPMAIAGGALWEPMAAVMIGGLAISSLLTLFFVPAGYFMMFRGGQRPLVALARNGWLTLLTLANQSYRQVRQRVRNSASD